jgi:hypothetical protein
MSKKGGFAYDLSPCLKCGVRKTGHKSGMCEPCRGYKR